jgi:hypothetical protein
MIHETFRSGCLVCAGLLGGGPLACYLAWGDASGRAKCILLALFVASWGLLLVPVHSAYLFPVAQLALGTVIAGMAFGVEWLMRFRRRWP